MESSFSNENSPNPWAKNKIIGNKDENDSDNEPEEILYEDSIIDSITSKFSELDSNDLLLKTIEHLKENIKPGICLICIENIESREAIWSCKNCYGILHLVCVQRWAKDSIHNSKEAAAKREFTSPIFWCCPKCRGEYKEEEFPNRYLCYCGKVCNPPFDPWTAPHSCGVPCGKPLLPLCGHNCLLLCHSGSCAPCPKQVTNSCFCGQSSPLTLRCNAKDWSCNNVCEKEFPSCDHKCPNICHKGECKICNVELKIQCNCSDPSMLTISCSEMKNSLLSCAKICSKVLGCGIHKCKDVCHRGDCGPCELSCPCGKEKVRCGEDGNSGKNRQCCQDTCDKTLDCGVHFCELKCHDGSCGSCLQLVKKKCNCQTYEKEVQCSKEFVCQSKCKKIKDCGVHPCNKKCCPGDCQTCRNTCGKTLGCKNHKCEMLCHRGPCYPCTLKSQVKCKCGKTVKLVPCGSEKKCLPPSCQEPCNKKSKCDHSSIQIHKCHFNECPKCQKICEKKLPSCDHSCPKVCHSSKVGNRTDCPKCLKLVPTKCRLHSSVFLQCFKVNGGLFKCEEICNKSLSCNQHSCAKICHEGISNECGECNAPCEKKRPIGCEHECSLGCHQGPCHECTLVAKISCHCESTTLFVQCSTQSLMVESKRSCKNQCPKKLSCGHRCLSICHSGECEESERCRRRVKVNCRCKVYKAELECFLVEKKVLDCGLTTCNVTQGSTKSPKESSHKKKNRKKSMEEKSNQEENLETSSVSLDDENPAAMGNSNWIFYGIGFLILSVLISNYYVFNQ